MVKGISVSDRFVRLDQPLKAPSWEYPREVIKHDASRHDGWQLQRINREGQASRMCHYLGCGREGAAQVQTLAGLEPYRIICKYHAVMLAFVIAKVSGHPNPKEFAKDAAGYVGADWDTLEIFTPPSTPAVSAPSRWVCFGCGGGMDPAPGQREWHHTCTLPKGEHYESPKPLWGSVRSHDDRG